MRRLLTATLCLILGLLPARVAASSSWGSPGYGDPPGWCTNFSDMWVATVVTNDPLVGTNPERNTFYGFHPNPGYDDWYGYFYGDFRGKPGDASGWTKLLHENYPSHYHWNFADKGWAVHGHAKEYIAYYNWTFGGQCGLGSYGSDSPPPFMADQYGYPVVDIYVDSVPPYAPKPRVTEMTPSSISFSWDPVSDQGDGAGKDFFASGIGHYLSWLTLDGSPIRLQAASTSGPRTLQQVGMTSRDTACVHVVAFDKLQNASAEQIACGGALAPPPMPKWRGRESQVEANPDPPGLVGLDAWFWLEPTPSPMTVDENYRGIEYRVKAIPGASDWDFGDGGGARFEDSTGYGNAYPQPSTVTRTYQAHDQGGYDVRSSVSYDVTWTALIGGRWIGPYPLGTVSLDSKPLLYPVQQAQPELVELGGRGQEADQPVIPSMSTATTGPAGLLTRYWA